MKVGQRRPASALGYLGQNIRWFGVLVLVFVIGLLAGSQRWDRLTRGLKAIPTLISQSLAPSSDLPTLVVDMNFTAYDSILDQREAVLRNGAYIPSGRDFVTATIDLDGVPIPVIMRLRAGVPVDKTIDHVGDDEKWDFEVRTRRDQQLLGMESFFLLDPADNNWLSQWAFARALADEGILVASYQFVRLVLNGDDRGIYALQEGFANGLLAGQGRPTGVVVWFDADLLWESIIQFEGDARAAFADPVANLSATDFRFFEIDTFREEAVSRDASLSAQADRAIGLLRALQTGELKPSVVFDREQYGRFLALVDLWGATQATSLVNLHYYYNPSTDRLEPLSSSANPLGSDERLALSTTYDDPVLQAVYVQEAFRISQPAYVDQLQTRLEADFRRLQRTATSGWAEHEEGEPLWAELRHRQEQIRRSLDPVHPVLAYLGSPTLTMSGTVRLDVGNTLNLPVEIIGFDIGGATFMPAEAKWLHAGSDELVIDQPGGLVLRAVDARRTPVVRYVHFEIELAEIQRLDNELAFMQELDVQIVTRILGLSGTQITRARHGYPVVPVLEANRR